MKFRVLLPALVLLFLLPAASAACQTLLSNTNTLLAADEYGNKSDEACFTIKDVNDVVLDCNSFSIIGWGMGKAVLIENSTNVLIRNCNVQNYSYGAHILDGAGNATVTGTNFSNNTFAAYIEDNCWGNYILNANSYNATNQAFVIESNSSYNVIDNCVAELNGNDGFVIGVDTPVSSYNNITNAFANNSGRRNFYLNYYHSQTLLQNTYGENAGEYGYYIRLGDNATFVNGTSVDSGYAEYYLRQTADNVLLEQYAYDSNVSFWLDRSDYNLVGNSFSHASMEHGFYIDDADNNTIENCTARHQVPGFGQFSGFFVDDSWDDTLFNCTAFNYTRAGITLYASAVGQTRAINVSDSVAYNNTYGFETLLVRTAVIQYSDSYSNTLDGFYFNTSGNTVWGIECDAYDNSRDGYRLHSSSIINLTGCEAYNNSGDGVGFLSGGVNLFAYGESYGNQGNGVHSSGPSTGNFVTFSEIYDNIQHGIYVEDGCNLHAMRFDNISGNGGWGFYSKNANIHIFINSSIFDNIGGGFLFASSDSGAYGDLEFYNNSEGGNYSIWMSSGSNSNVFVDVLIVNDSNYIYQQPTAPSENNFTGLTIGYNFSIGLVKWGFMNITELALNSSNFIPYWDFVSLDDAQNPQANRSANITIWSPYCSPTPSVWYATGFPQSRAAIFAANMLYPGANVYSCSNNIVTFDVLSFSGYAVNVTFDECFYANDDDTLYMLTGNLEGNKSDQICITINASNIMIDCSGFNVTGNHSGITGGISTYVTSGVENVTVANCFVSNYTVDAFFDLATNVTIYNNTMYNSTNAIRFVSGIRHSRIVDNVVHDTSDWGIRIDQANYTNVTGNFAYNNTGTCAIGTSASALSSNYMLFEDNIVLDNTLGMCALIAHNSTFYNNTVRNNTDGFVAFAAWDNDFEYNRIYDNTASGLIVAVFSQYNEFTDNEIYNNFDGLLASDSANSNYTNNTVHGNANIGIHISNCTGSRLALNTLYNNYYDLLLNNTDTVNPMTVNMTNTSFLNPAGTPVNYTVLSLDDDVWTSSAFSINWTANTHGLPTERISFNQKFVNITAHAGTPLIDTITWHWLPSELGSYNELRFELWKWNTTAGWTMLNDTPDTENNTITLLGLEPASDFGILQNNGSDCQIINTPGSYQMLANGIGAPYDASEVPAISWACIKIASDNVDFSCNGFNITNNGTATAAGIVVNGSAAVDYENVTIRDCPDITEYWAGIYIHDTINNTVTNTTTRNNTDRAIYVRGVSNSFFIDNIAHGHPLYALYLTGSDFNILDGNIARDNTGTCVGFTIAASDDNNLTGNLVYSTPYGIDLQSNSARNRVISNAAENLTNWGFRITGAGSTDNILVNNTARNMQNSVAFTLPTGARTWLENNTAENATVGFVIGHDGSNLTNNTAIYNRGNGFSLTSDGCILLNNTAMENTGSGFDMDSTDGFLLVDNFAFNNSVHGFLLDNTATGNEFYSNRAFGHHGTGFGFRVDSAPANNFTDNIACNNTAGFSMSSSINLMLLNNTACNNTNQGFYIWWDTGSTSYNDTAFGNDYGFAVYQTNNLVLDYPTVYDNSYDMYFQSTIPAAFTVNVTNATFLNPLGTYQNYTVLSLDDSIDANRDFSLNWTQAPVAPPGGFIPFDNKYMEISRYLGAVSIDSATWHWTQAEVIAGGYNEAKFELWKYNVSDGWVMLNNSPDTTLDMLGLSGFDPASTYAIFENNLSTCMIINASGTYGLANSIEGAPFATPEVPDIDFACIKINASNVLFSCGGHNITHNESTTAAAIVVNGSTTIDYTNVTIVDCPYLAHYYAGVYTYRTREDTIDNVTAYNNSRGFYIRITDDSNVTDSRAMDSTGIGFFVSGSNGCMLLGDTASDSGTYGFSVGGSDSNTFADSVSYGTGDHGFYFAASSDGNNVTNCTAHSNGDQGFYLASNTGNNLTDNVAYNNSQNGIYLNDADGATLTGNDAHNNTIIGFYFVDSSGANLIGNLAYNNTLDGINMVNSNDALLINNTAYENIGSGIKFSSGGALLVNNTAYGNGYSGLYLQVAENNTLLNNDAYNNTWHGIQLDTCANTTFIGDRTYNNTLRGFAVFNSITTNLTNSTAAENLAGGLYFLDSDLNTIMLPDLRLNNLSGGYEIEMDSNSDMNTFTDVFLWETSNYLQQDATAALQNNFTNLTIAYNQTIGIVNWAFLGVTDVTIDSTTAYLRTDFVSLDTPTEAQMNAPANVTIFTPYCPDPVIYRRAGFPQTRGEIIAYGSVYPTAIHSCAANLVTFDAYTFSGYSAGNYSNLTIWDTNDTGVAVYTYELATFYANYTNTTDGAPITNLAGDCYVMHNDSPVMHAMAYNAGSGLWEYSRTFMLAGSYDWNVTCNSTSGFDALFATDNITILQGCFYADAPGTYTLPNSLPGNKSDRACITVNASNVIIDCAGYNVTGNMFAGSGTYGIMVNNSNAVTLRNCNVTRYDQGVYFIDAANSIARNITAIGNYWTGFNVTSSTGIMLFNSSVSGAAGMAGMALHGNSLNVSGNLVNEPASTWAIWAPSYGGFGSSSTFSDNTILASGNLGLVLEGTGHSVVNNSITGVPLFGVVCGDDPSLFSAYKVCDAADFFNNTITANGVGGLLVINGDTVAVEDNGISNHGMANLIIYNSTAVDVHRNHINTSQMGIALLETDLVTIVDGNRVFGHTQFEIVALNNNSDLTIEENIDAAQTYFTMASPCNITDLYLLYNFSDTAGRVHFPSVESAGRNVTLNRFNFRLERDFISLNDTNATEFNATADVTVNTSFCGGGFEPTVYREQGFPQAWLSIVTNGAEYAAAYVACAVPTIDFGVTGFSGYAINMTPIPPSGGGGETKYLELETDKAVYEYGEDILAHVEDKHHDDVSGAKVYLRHISTSSIDNELTDSDGEASFTADRLGDFSLWASKSGYVTSDKAYITVIEAPLEIDAPGSVDSGEEFTVTVTSHGVPVPGVLVTFDGATGTTDSNGQVTFTAGDPGEYTITATKYGYETATAGITVNEVEEPVEPEEPEEPGGPGLPGEEQELVIHSPPEAQTGDRITVTVTDQNGTIVPGAQVDVRGSTGITDEYGEVVLTVPGEAGGYWIHAVKAGYGPDEERIVVSAPGVEPEPVPPEEQPTLLETLLTYWWLFLLLLLLLLALLFLRRRKKKRKRPPREPE